VKLRSTLAKQKYNIKTPANFSLFLFVEQNPLLPGYLQQNPALASPYRPSSFYNQQYPLYYPAVASGSPYGSQGVPYQGVYPAVSNPFYQAPYYTAASTYSSGHRASVKYKYEVKHSLDLLDFSSG
jgi:hypothetical protein